MVISRLSAGDFISTGSRLLLCHKIDFDIL
jgi:hypothetical protein